MAGFIRTILQWIRQIWEWILSHLRGGGGTIEDDRCCYLARRDNECHWVGDKASFKCPPGYYRQWWHCCEGTRLIGCGECTTNTTACWSGNFECSIWWWTNQAC